MLVFEISRASIVGWISQAGNWGPRMQELKPAEINLNGVYHVLLTFMVKELLEIHR
jgi:hypothetical protein